MTSRPTLLAVLLIAGCSTPTDIDGYDPRGVRLSPTNFTTWSTWSGDQPAPPLEVVVDDGVILATGLIDTADPCYDVMAFARVRGTNVSLDIVAARKHGVLCIQVLNTFAYSASLENLRSGTYSVQVSHIVSGHAEVVLEETVTVQ